jgi:putative transposase
VTVCVNGRKCLFGEVENGEMVLNKAGEMVDKWWRELENKYDGIDIDEYCVMPNHIHGIICIVGAHLCVRPDVADRCAVARGRILF